MVKIPRQRKAPVRVRVLALFSAQQLIADFRAWRLRTGCYDADCLADVVRHERAQAAQGAVLASEGVKARIAGGRR